MAWVAAVQAVASIFGASEQSKAAIKEKSALKIEGIQREKAARLSARQMDIAAEQELAASQHEAREAIRQSEILQSRALAIGGASGAGVNDPTFLKIAGDLAAEGQLAAQTYLAKGKDAARNFRLQAEITRWEGEQARRGYNVQAKSVESARRTSYAAGIITAAGKAWDAYSDYRKSNSSSSTD